MRQFNFAKNIFLSNFQVLGFPYKLTFAVTYQCNLRCQICQIWKKKRKKEMTTKEIKEFFEKNNYFNWVDLTGGEIFLRDDLLEIVKAILTNCRNLYLFHYPTNGYLTEKIVTDTKDILKLSPPKLIVTVSLDGPKRLHDKLRGTRGSWERAIKTYQKLRELNKKNFEVFLGMTIFKDNLGKFDDTFGEVRKYIREISYNDFHLNLAQTSSHFYGNLEVDLGINKKMIEEIKKIKQQKKRQFSGVQFLENRYQSLIAKYLEIKKSPLDCQSLSASVFIDPYGNIYPCAIWDKKIANLKEIRFDLKKIWHLSRVKETRKKIADKQCPGCWTPCEAYQTILGNLIRI